MDGCSLPHRVAVAEEVEGKSRSEEPTGSQRGGCGCSGWGDENMTNGSRDAADGDSMRSPLEEFSDFHGGHYLNPKE